MAASDELPSSSIAAEADEVFENFYTEVNDCHINCI